MEELLAKLFANGLEGFPGMRVRGSLPLRDQVLNEFVQEGMQQVAGSSVAQPSADSSAPTLAPPKLPGGLSPQQILPFLDLRIESQQGQLMVHFQVKVPD